MSATVSELIGQIIDPRPGAPDAGRRRPAPAAGESLQVLLGRIVAPQRPPSGP